MSSEVLPLPSWRDDRYRSLHFPTLKETSLDRDQYLLRLAQTIRMDFASRLGILGIAVSEACSLEYWVEEAISDWQSLLDDDDDDEDCAGNERDSTEFLEGTRKSAEVTSGSQVQQHVNISRRMPEHHRQYRRAD